MGKPTGFKEHAREMPQRRPVAERVRDWKEYETHLPAEKLQTQASRCMDCGIPFCQSGCPLGNIIPDWNDLIYKQRWEEAIERLHATNNFPEFTGTLCPAPCENSCVLAMNSYQQPVTIKKIEWEIIEHAWEKGWVKPMPPKTLTGKKVAVVGSGPAGLAAAQQLTRAGHAVTVFERADRIGGLLRYGIPEFKMEKQKLDRRLRQMEAEGTRFVANANVGVSPAVETLRKDFHAVVLCAGATQPRDLNVPGRELKGVHFAMEYLTQSNRSQHGDKVENQIHAAGKHVIVLGGGDTGADCIGTALRQGAKSVTSLELLPQPPNQRAADNPWPQWARVHRVAGAHEEGGERVFSVSTKRLSGENGILKKLHGVKLDWVPQPNGNPAMKEIAGSDFELDADLMFLAMGFTGPEKNKLVTDLGVELDPRGNVKADGNKMTSVPGVFVAGDMTRGQSLIVWAISEGRKAAQGVDLYLMGETSLTSVL